jgi:5-methylcytosine-specific restriction endonuclease McrA
MENEDKKPPMKIPDFDPTQDLSQAPSHKTRKRGLGAKPLLENEIKEAQSKARSAMEAARLLGVSYNTYKKYARKYGIFENLKNPDGTGIRKGYNIKRGKYALDDMIKGKYPNYPVHKFKSRLLKNGYKQEKCENCGFEERRIIDHKVPLVLNFKDGNRKNHQWDNLEMLCFNCYYLTVGNLVGPKNLYDY